MQNHSFGSVLALDIGDKRIGVARASLIARLPEPLEHLDNDDQVALHLQKLIDAHQITVLVVGIPRNASGEETAQSQKIRDITAEITKDVSIPLHFVDESLSSVRADEYLSGSKSKASQDSIAACYILQQYLDIIERS